MSWRITPTSTTWAEGGDLVYTIVVSGTTYRVHEFKTVGTTSLNVMSGGNVDYLVVAGGGGGGAINAGGGGAGGYRCSVTGENSGGGASAEAPLTLSAGAYTVTVGAGGVGGLFSGSAAASGSNSVFATITTIGGGRGGGP
jgi:hypothetical protein